MKVNLLDYLAKLEATAKEASGGRWTEVNDWNSTNPKAPMDTIETTRPPSSPGERIAWGDTVHVQIANFGDDYENADANRVHIIATQPRATLALIAKLRQAVIGLRMVKEGGSAEVIHWGELDELLQIEVTE